MKRDMDLIRTILIEIEKSPGAIYGSSEFKGINDHSSDEIQFHLHLLFEAGFIRAIELGRGLGDFRYNVQNITWEGYEFLEKARNEKNWTAAKDMAKQVGSFSIDIIKTILTQLLLGQLKDAMN